MDYTEQIPTRESNALSATNLLEIADIDIQIQKAEMDLQNLD